MAQLSVNILNYFLLFDAFLRFFFANVSWCSKPEVIMPALKLVDFLTTKIQLRFWQVASNLFTLGDSENAGFIIEQYCNTMSRKLLEKLEWGPLWIKSSANLYYRPIIHKNRNVFGSVWTWKWGTSTFKSYWLKIQYFKLTLIILIVLIIYWVLFHQNKF